VLRIMTTTMKSSSRKEGKWKPICLGSFEGS
jgi:hypothetical protein